MRHSLLAAFLLTFALFASAQDASPWVGQEVVTKYQTPLRIENQVVATDETSTVYRVERASGDWLWLTAEDGRVSGWVQSQHVIPFSQAIDYFTNQIRVNPSEYRGYLSRGKVWGTMGEYDLSIADFNEAIRRNPTSEIAWDCRAVSRFRKQEFESAIADYSEAIRLNPEYAPAYRGRGDAREQQKEFDKAIADYSEAIRLAPNDEEAYFNRANAWWAKNDYDKAIADYSEAIRLAPRYEMAYNRGNAWSAKKEYDKAIADFDHALRLDPKHVDCYLARGAAWFGKKDYDKALADFNEALRLDPRSTDALGSRARLRSTCPDARYRDGQKAFADASQACQLDNYQTAHILDTLAATYAECGDFARAIEWQDKANRLLTDAGDKKKAEERIKLYQDKKPYREP
jgi:tetratricopeptide (TPR) repeat protein